MNYSTIFFDGDGVTLKSKYLFSEQLEMDYGIKAEAMQPFFKGPFKQCTLGKADLKAELAKVIDSWGWKGTVDELIHFWLMKGTQVDNQMIDFIKSLDRKGVRCFMVTDQEKYRGEHLRQTLGGGIVFQDVFFSAAIGFAKKQREFWDYVLKATNSKLDMILYIDDGQENIEAARSFGIEAHYYQGLNGLKEYLSG